MGKRKNKRKRNLENIQKTAVKVVTTWSPRIYKGPQEDTEDGFIFRPLLAHSQIEGEKVCIRTYYPYIQVQEGHIVAKDTSGALLELREVEE